MSNSAREPSSDMRQAGLACHEAYVSLKDAGFTEAQALQLVAAMLLGNQGDTP